METIRPLQLDQWVVALIAGQLAASCKGPLTARTVRSIAETAWLILDAVRVYDDDMPPLDNTKL